MYTKYRIGSGWSIAAGGRGEPASSGDRTRLSIQDNNYYTSCCSGFLNATVMLDNHVKHVFLS